MILFPEFTRYGCLIRAATGSKYVYFTELFGCSFGDWCPRSGIISWIMISNLKEELSVKTWRLFQETKWWIYKKAVWNSSVTNWRHQLLYQHHYLGLPVIQSFTFSLLLWSTAYCKVASMERRDKGFGIYDVNLRENRVVSRWEEFLLFCRLSHMFVCYLASLQWVHIELVASWAVLLELNSLVWLGWWGSFLQSEFIPKLLPYFVLNNSLQSKFPGGGVSRFWRDHLVQIVKIEGKLTVYAS